MREKIPCSERCLCCDGYGCFLGCAGDRHNPVCNTCNGTGRSIDRRSGLTEHIDPRNLEDSDRFDNLDLD